MKQIAWVLSGENSILFCLAQLVASSIADCRFLTFCFCDRPRASIAMSSANRYLMVNGVDGKSFMKSENSRGEITAPWGTPCSMFLVDDLQLLIST